MTQDSETLKIGLRGGFFHPITGYSLADVLRVADAVAGVSAGAWTTDGVRAALEQVRAGRRSAWRFGLVLKTMLFKAADAPNRVRIFDRFYRLSEALVARFYAGAFTWKDRARILSGKPPVSVWRATRVLGQAVVRGDLSV